MLGDLVENTVAALPSLFNVSRFEGKTEALRCGVRLMNGQVTPPDAAIVPKVVIRVFVVHSQRELGFPFHAFQCLEMGFKKGLPGQENELLVVKRNNWSGISGACKEI